MLKRFSALLLSLMLLLSCAQAVPDVPYAPETLLVYYAQTEPVQRVIDILYEGVMRHETLISLPPATRYDDADAAVSILWEEFPELFHFEDNASIAYFQSAPEYAISVEFTYSLTPEEYAGERALLMQEAQEIVQSAVGSDYERELLLHDAVSARTVYSDDLGAQHSYTAYGALVQGNAVCEGYAQALTLLCRLSGIPCSTISGTAQADGETQLHAWNAVRIGGEIVQTDCTFNDTDDETVAVHWYFNLPVQDMALSHQSDTRLAMSSSDAWIYARRSGEYIDSAEEMQAAFDAQYAYMLATGRPMELRAANQALYQELRDSISTLMGNSAYDVGSMTIYSEATLCSLTLVE